MQPAKCKDNGKPRRGIKHRTFERQTFRFINKIRDIDDFIGGPSVLRHIANNCLSIANQIIALPILL